MFVSVQECLRHDKASLQCLGSRVQRQCQILLNHQVWAGNRNVPEVHALLRTGNAEQEVAVNAVAVAAT
ncbi:hypothetical protein NQZ68_002005 [Dissostichus eleginoides]|nr:hypothetical protein NQZ68_002005 [Dissostichus eleginoides]